MDYRKVNIIIIPVLILLMSTIIFFNCTYTPNYVEKIDKILEYGDSGYYTDQQYDNVFKIIEDNPQTFEYDFSSYLNTGIGNEKMKYVVSDDKNVRAYILERNGFSGNPSLGVNTQTLIQYHIAHRIYTFRTPETYSVIEKIAKLSNNQYLFITYYGNMAQGEHNTHQARVYQINKNGVSQLQCAFEKDEHFVSEIEVYWEGKLSSDDESELVSTECLDKGDYENTLYFGIYYNKFDDTLYVANTTTLRDDDHSYERVVLNGTYNYYQWNGKSFKNVTIMDPYEVKNKDYYIRIEQGKDGRCIYKCWNGGKKVGSPNLTIFGGKRKKWDELGANDYNRWISFDAYKPLGEEYKFINNGYSYQYLTGWHKGRTYEELNVYSLNGDLIYSNDFERTISYR